MQFALFLHFHLKKIALLALFFLSFAVVSTRAQQAGPSDSVKPSTDHVKDDSSELETVVIESWEEPSLAGSELHAAEPLVGEFHEEETFTRQFVEVQWRPNDPIYLYVIRPKGVANPPAVLYLYSYPDEPERFKDDKFCAMLTRNGVAAVGFVGALTGHRYHDRPFNDWFVSRLQESLVKSTHDVQMILNYLHERGDIDMDRIGMFGDGSGATIAILAAGVDSRIKVLDLLNPWGDWPVWLDKSTLVPEKERPQYTTPEFLKKVAGLDPVTWLPKLNNRQVRLHILKNAVSVTPEAAKQHIQAAAPATAKISLYEDLGAFMLQAASGGRIFEWMWAQLQEAPSNELKRASESPVQAIPSKQGDKTN